jgi:hypothetical protein
MGVGVQRHAPTALPPGKTRYPLYRLGGPQGQSGRMRKISPLPPGFDPWTVQPVASPYTYWPIPAHWVRLPANITVFRNGTVIMRVTCHSCRRQRKAVDGCWSPEVCVPIAFWHVYVLGPAYFVWTCESYRTIRDVTPGHCPLLIRVSCITWSISKLLETLSFIRVT